MATPSTSSILLCGGLSRRMGRAKAVLPWRGRTLIEHVVDVLAEATDEVVVVSAADESTAIDLPDLPATVVQDQVAELGPLAGIREGLNAISKPLAYVTSTDAPFLTAEFVRAVLASGRTAAVVIDDFVQPLVAAYEKRLAQEAARLLEVQRRRPLFLLESADYRPISASELPSLEPLRNLNTPEDYLAAVREDYANRGAEIPPVTIELLGLARERGGIDGIEIEPTTLGEALRQVTRASSVEVTVADPALLFSLGGRHFIRGESIPLGPGEQVVVMDAAAGG